MRTSSGVVPRADACLRPYVSGRGKSVAAICREKQALSSDTNPTHDLVEAFCAGGRTGPKAVAGGVVFPQGRKNKVLSQSRCL